MEDDGEISPPLPKGTYNFNFDEFDENTNPFESKKRLDISPTRSCDGNDGSLNPFKSRSNFARSPPRKDNNRNEKVKLESPVDNNFDTNDIQEENSKENVSNNESSIEILDRQSKETTRPSQQKKKTSGPKKSIRKPKVKSNFKPLPNFGLQEGDGDDIQIFSTKASQAAAETEASLKKEVEPIQEIESVKEVEPLEPMKEQEPTEEPPQADQLSNQDSGFDDLPASQMTESFHEFGAGEMAEEANEGFAPASEVLNDDAAWEMMEKMHNADNTKQGRASLLKNFDPLTEDQGAVGSEETEVPSKPTESTDTGFEDEDLLLMNTPPNKTLSGRDQLRQHPAARVLKEQLEGDAAPREARKVDIMFFSPEKGEQKPGDEEVYYDAPDYLPTRTRPNTLIKQNDKTISVKSGDNNKDAAIVQLVQVLKYSQSDWNKLKQDLELDFQARLLNKEREWSRKLADRDKKMANLEEQVSVLRSANEDMRQVVTEFEKTIAQLHVEKEKTTSESQNTYEEVVKERDQALDDLQSVESAFSDLHQRYERTKGVVEGLRKNEEVLKKCVQDYQVKLKEAEDKCAAIRLQAEEKLDIANQEMDKLRKSTTSDVARLEAALRKTDLKVQGLERSLEQKVKENQELTAICDELIAKTETSA
ncbi:hypothetical protein CHS0354_008284 [Potamilus streckersoni]|uniref:Transforming acidic coiled-coil-containing protein C-terminal domain-containing protein n=1 Tax=Potamilus streckersoni TaxID=2493646 RepID=A0AAE0SIC0_9BIVA|nr:hypothetical protein CHS0354_008284 [Potamilus streckersoni]